MAPSDYGWKDRFVLVFAWVVFPVRMIRLIKQRKAERVDQ